MSGCSFTRCPAFGRGHFGDKINLMIPKQLFNRIIYTLLIVTGVLFSCGALPTDFGNGLSGLILKSVLDS
jgi:hypothetical protein